MSRLVKWRDRAIWIAIAAAVIVIAIQDAREANRG